MATVDLSQLPVPDVVEVLDYETILAERKATLISLYPEDQQEAITRTLALESEPIVKLLQENAYREVIWRQRVNEAALAVTLLNPHVYLDTVVLIGRCGREQQYRTPDHHPGGHYHHSADACGYGVRHRPAPARATGV